MPISRLNRSVLRLSGASVKAWLSGLITNNIGSEITFAALLTPQGKIIADFFVTQTPDGLLIDTPLKFGTTLEKRLKLYKLRAPITIENISEDVSVYAAWDTPDTPRGAADPRHPSLGTRFITQDTLTADGDYNAHRLSLGVVDSEWDFETATTFPADANMDLMNGVDFKKGCFIGQEVVSRMKRMTIVKKRMRGVIFNGDAAPDDKVMAGERVIGEIISVHDQMGMAIIRLNRWETAEVDPMVNDNAIEIMDSVDGQSG